MPTSLSDVCKWELARGQTSPVLGWYSPSFGTKEPAWSLMGRGTTAGPTRLVTSFRLPVTP